jgi:arginyl-tRNA--protein-N-Asp/Glu arginylyltransferase
MKLLFSEARPDYPHYVFPYAIWAFPEPGETPADFFDRGFLPSSPNLDRFYLCRHIRIVLRRFRHSSENRRILRKGSGIQPALIPRSRFDFTAGWREFCRRYANAKFGPGVLSDDRLERLFNSRITSHVMIFSDDQTGQELGLATLFLQEPVAAYYYHAFYDLDCGRPNLGMFMMTATVEFCARQGVEFLYLGSCYSQNALYKTQFAGVQFFNGFRWSGDLSELKFLLKRDQDAWKKHLLEDPAFHQAFHPDLEGLAGQSCFRSSL